MTFKRSLWTGLAAALRHGGRRGARLYLDFRRRANRRTPVPRDVRALANSFTPHQLQRLRAARLLFVLPTAAQGGGARVVLTESRSLRWLGIDVWIANLEANRARFDTLLSRDDAPAIYLRRYDSIKALAHEFDIVIATAWQSTAALRALAALDRPPLLAYYIQDYEPYFYDAGSDQHVGARASYLLPQGSILFTKTQWNQQQVLRNEGIRPVVIGASYDSAVFNTQGRMRRDTVVRLCAMVRPETPRRAPALTLDVLRSLKRRYGQRLHVAVFGCTRESLEAAPFDARFEFEHLGILDDREVAQLLRRSDIFLDLSAFQAMGLTAMEAMACGVAVIGPVHGGLAEVIQHGVSGLLIDTHDENACVEAAASLIDDPALVDRLACAASSSVTQFSADRAAERLARLLILQDPAFEGSPAIAD